MTQSRALILLTIVVSARAAAFLFSKTALIEVSPFFLLALRFLGAFAILAIVFARNIRALSRAGLAQGSILGAILAILMGAEMHALPLTSTSSVAFIENSAVVFVPLASWLVFHERLGKGALASSIVALAGIALLTVGESGFAHIGLGELFALAAAALYTVLIIATGRFARRHDPLGIGAVQMGAAGAVCLLISLATESPTIPQTATSWTCIAVLIVVCSVFGFAFQPVAQRHLNDAQTSMVCALNPAIAMALGVAVLHEPLSPTDGAGALLILASLAIGVADAARQTKVSDPQKEPIATKTAPSPYDEGAEAYEL